MSPREDIEVLRRLQREITRRVNRGLFTPEQLPGVGAIGQLLQELVRRSEARAAHDWTPISGAWRQ